MCVCVRHSLFSPGLPPCMHIYTRHVTVNECSGDVGAFCVCVYVCVCVCVCVWYKGYECVVVVVVVVVVHA